MSCNKLQLLSVFFCILDLLGVCIQIGDVEVCCNSVTQTEITKRDITLVDKSMATVSYVFTLVFYEILYMRFILAVYKLTIFKE